MQNFFSFPAARAAAPGILLALAACGGSGTDDTALLPPPDNGTVPVSIAFAARANGAPVNCQTPLAALGAGAAAAALHDLRFYVSEVHLLDRQGARVPLALDANEWQMAEHGLALVDLEDGSASCAEKGTPEMHPQISGQVPAGDYAGLEFVLGVPAALNHSDFAAATAPLDVGALAWSWQAGRKFLQLEVNPAGGVRRPEPAAPAQSFFVHLGATGCSGNPVTGETVSCARPNRVAVVLDAFDFARQQVVLDVGQLFAESRIDEDRGGAVGCMSGLSDPECAAIFARLGLDLSLGTPLEGALRQSVFLAADKP